MKTTIAAIALAMLAPAAMAWPMDAAPAQAPLTLQQQLDLAKASVDRTFDGMTNLILQQEAQNAKLVADVAALKKPAEPPAPAAAAKPKPILHDAPAKEHAP